MEIDKVVSDFTEAVKRVLATDLKDLLKQIQDAKSELAQLSKDVAVAKNEIVVAATKLTTIRNQYAEAHARFSKMLAVA